MSEARGGGGGGGGGGSDPTILPILFGLRGSTEACKHRAAVALLGAGAARRERVRPAEVVMVDPTALLSSVGLPRRPEGQRKLASTATVALLGAASALRVSEARGGEVSNSIIPSSSVFRVNVAVRG